MQNGKGTDEVGVMLRNEEPLLDAGLRLREEYAGHGAPSRVTKTIPSAVTGLEGGRNGDTLLRSTKGRLEKQYGC